VAGRYVGLDREVQLGQPPALPPLTHQRAERRTMGLDGGGHGPSVAHAVIPSHYLEGNCVTYLSRGTVVA
jgi:hypothetical protein